MRIRNLFRFLAFLGLFTMVSCDFFEKTPPKNSKKLIAQNMVESEKEKPLVSIAKLTSEDKGFSILDDALKVAEFKEILNGKRRYTIFAPINQAFEDLSAGTVEKLLLPENRNRLSKILRYHIIPGQINEKDIIKAIDERRGSVTLRTLGGKKLMATRKNGTVYLIDEMGNRGRLITTDIEASNGFMHTIDGVMMTK